MSPRFGELLPADVWAASARTLTDISAEEIFDLPDLDSGYATVQPTSGAGVDLFGAWVEISADIGAGKRIIGATVMCLGAVSPLYELEFGEGAAGAEARITRVAARVTWQTSFTGPNQLLHVPLWRSLTNNARLSCRVRDNDAGAVSYQLTVLTA